MSTTESAELSPPEEESPDWHSIPLERVFERVASDTDGLSTDEVNARLDEYGPNEIGRGDEISPLEIFVSQFQDFLIYVLFFYGLESTGDLVRAQTLLFTFLVVVEVVRIHVIRSRYDLSLLSNRWLVAAIAVTLLLQLLVLYTPLNDFFDVLPLSIDDWTWSGVAFVGFLVLNVGMDELFDRIFASSSQ